MSNNITIHILRNGESRQMEILLQEGDTVEWVESRVRSTFNVVGGTLSSRQDRIVVVRSLTAGGVYYFLEAQVALRVGKY